MFVCFFLPPPPLSRNISSSFAGVIHRLAPFSKSVWLKQDALIESIYNSRLAAPCCFSRAATINKSHCLLNHLGNDWHRSKWSFPPMWHCQTILNQDYKWQRSQSMRQSILHALLCPACVCVCGLVKNCFPWKMKPGTSSTSLSLVVRGFMCL